MFHSSTIQRILVQRAILALSGQRNLHRTIFLKDIKVKMPSLSPTMTAGTIVKWNKKEGDPIQPGDLLCEIQTDKAVMGFEMEEEGTLAKILMPDNSLDVPVGTLIAILAESGEDWKSIKIPAGISSPAKKFEVPKISKDEKISKVSKPVEISHAAENPMGPAVRLLLQLYQLDAKKISGSGPHGRLLKGDVLDFITKNRLNPKPQKASKPPPVPKAEEKAKVEKSRAPVGKFTDIPLSNMRKTIAKRLTAAKTSIPHAYASATMKIDNILALRKLLKSENVAVTLNDFVIKSAAVALRLVPEVNVQYIGDQIHPQSTVDVSVAVATESGLITPIVFNADRLGLSQIAAKVRELAEKAKHNRLQLSEFQGGTFTISNLGMFGISHFTAIINPPQAAILAIGGGQPILEPEKKGTNLTVTLCYDGRAISETDAGRFLSAFQQTMENPEFLNVGAALKKIEIRQ